MDGMQPGISRDSWEKVTGQAIYTPDIIIPGMMHGKLLRSPHAHARIRSIDASAAMAMPGVACVVTGADADALPAPVYGVVLWDQPLLASDRVRYVGDIVAAVVAVDEATAFRAACTIRVDYEVLPPLMDMDAATAPGAPLLFETATDGPGLQVGQGSRFIRDPAPNVLCEYSLEYGDAEAELAASAQVFTDTFHFSRLGHGYLEPHVNIARWQGGRVELWSNNQDPFVLRGDVARIFGLPLHAVRFHTALVGGGFGGKSYCKMEPLVALMARKARAPVRLALTFDESMLTTTKHGCEITLTTGVDAQARLTARRALVRLDAGAYADASAMVAVKSAFRIGGPYRWRAIDSTAHAIRTTSVPGGSFRGFGGTQSSWASESQIDMIARRLGLCPVEFRKRNTLNTGEDFAPGDSAMDSDLNAGLDEVTTRLGWDAPRAPGRGVGVAIGLKDGGGTGNHAQAIVRLTHSGEAIVSSAVVEIGQGARTAICRLAAERLGIDEARVTYAPLDTDHTAPDNGTHVSCGTTVTGLAVVEAAGQAHAQLMEFAAAKLGCPVAELVLENWHIRRGNEAHPLEPMIRGHYGGMGWEFIGRGAFKDPYIASAPLNAKNMFWIPCWSGAEVEVDAETGRVTIHKLVVGADAGRAVDHTACIGQIEGAAAQALSQAMFEHLRYDGEAPVNAAPLDYRMLQTPDLPALFEGFVIEGAQGPGPGRLKGIGEAGMLGIAAAIANAIADATGARLTAMPFTPELVLAAMEADGAA
jgi:CO/xanthine dehydrogenase Mo-binding subunit